MGETVPLILRVLTLLLLAQQVAMQPMIEPARRKMVASDDSSTMAMKQCSIV